MAVYRLHTQPIKRSAGKSVVAAAAYRAGEKMKDERQNLTHNYTKKEDVAHAEILLPKNALEWMKDRKKLWNHVEAIEQRKDSRLAREIQLTLPRELTIDQNINLTKEFVQKNFVDQGIVADVCVHSDKNNHNPHAHVLLSTREIVNNEFGQKNRGLDKKEALNDWRKEWAILENEHLQKHGHDIQVDHRSHADRGIDLEPKNYVPYIQKKTPDKSKTHEQLVELNRIAKENGNRIINDPSIALDTITYHQSTFTQKELDNFLKGHTLGDEQFNQAKNAIKSSTEIIRLGIDEKGNARYTAKSLMYAENAVFEKIKTLNQKKKHVVNDEHINNAVSTRTLYNEQEKALKQIVKGHDISCLIGKAGTGKSYTLNAVREAYEKQGYNVRGCALAGIAAVGLKESSGIESKTIHKMLYDWEKDRSRLNRNTILVVDEAGMVGTRQMHKLIEHANKVGAKLLLVGDEQQLQPIEAGSVFRSIVEKTGASLLEDVQRQNEEWQRKATTDLSGDKKQIANGLDRYIDNGKVITTDTFKDAKNELIKNWEQAYSDEKSSLILAFRNKDVVDLNQKARESLKAAKIIEAKGEVVETEFGRREFAVNDRILFRKNEYSLDVWNGSLGTIQKIDSQEKGGSFFVKLDNGKQVEFDPKLYKKFEHGYASTVHKSQGATVDNTYVLGSTHFDKHLNYVAMTRHKEDVNLYTSTDNIGFKNTAHMKDVMSRERPKSLIYQFADYRNISTDSIKEVVKDILKGAIPKIKERMGLKDIQKGAISKLKNREEVVGERIGFKDIQKGGVPEIRVTPKNKVIPKNREEVVGGKVGFKDIQKSTILKNSEEELKEFTRAINLSEYAAYCGYEKDTSKSSKSIAIMRKGDDKISIKKAKSGEYLYYDWQDKKGGSIIDFVKNQQSKNIGEVRKELRPWIGKDSKPKVNEIQYQEKIEPIEPIKKDRKHAYRELHAYCHKREIVSQKYLEEERKIDKSVLAHPKFLGQIHEDRMGNAVFPQFDKKGLSCLEYRNTNCMRFTKEAPKALWTSKSSPTDKRLVFTEGPIDALSYHQLKGDDHTRYMSIGGNMSLNQKNLVKSAVARMPAGSEIIIAMDRDAGGDKLTKDMKELISREDVKVIRDIPASKDWNQQLKDLSEPKKPTFEILKEKNIKESTIEIATNKDKPLQESNKIHIIPKCRTKTVTETMTEGDKKTIKDSYVASHNRYLEEDQNISSRTLQNGRFEGFIYADTKGSPIYPYKDSNSKIYGFEKYSNKDQEKISTKGSAGVWRSKFNDSDKRLVITSNPVDALSYHQLSKKDESNTRYVAISSNMNEKQKEILEGYVKGMKKDADIVIATRDKKQDGSIKSMVPEKKITNAHNNWNNELTDQKSQSRTHKRSYDFER